MKMYALLAYKNAIIRMYGEWVKPPVDFDMKKYQKARYQVHRFQSYLLAKFSDHPAWADLEEARKTAVLVKQVSDQRAELARERYEHKAKWAALWKKSAKWERNWYLTAQAQLRSANALANQRWYWARAWKRAAKYYRQWATYYEATSGGWHDLWMRTRQERNEYKARAELAERQFDEAQSWANYFYEQMEYIHSLYTGAQEQRDEYKARAEEAERECNDLRKRLDMMRGHALKAMDERDEARRVARRLWRQIKRPLYVMLLKALDKEQSE